jgi:WXG100 family type VII secretion target
MSDLRVNAEAVKATAASVEDASQTLQVEFDRICAAVDEVIGASWTGQAADGMRKDWAKWCEGFTDVTAGLRREADALHEAAARYTKTDEGGSEALAHAMGL